MQGNFEKDVEKCLAALNAGGLILYPTDTIWGIGCDATNKNAVEKIFALKNREDKKTMIILVADEENIYNYVEKPNEKIFTYLSATKKPTTVIYQHAKNLNSLISSDGTIAIRIVKDDFCKELIFQFKKPIVSTSANISGEAPPKNFSEINPAIKNGVDYIVQHRQKEFSLSQPSSIIKLDEEGNVIVIRK